MCDVKKPARCIVWRAWAANVDEVNAGHDGGGMLRSAALGLKTA
jgi:hypothetical protein